jgi:hypothetical protein
MKRGTGFFSSCDDACFRIIGFAVSLSEEFIALGKAYEKNVSLALPEGVSKKFPARA